MPTTPSEQTSRRRPASASRLAMMAMLLAVAWPARAALDARAAVTVRMLPVGSPSPVLVFQDSVQDLDLSGSSAAIGLDPGLPYVSTASGMNVFYGAVHGFAHADANHPGGGRYYSDASSAGRFTDQFRVTAPGASGAGTMTLHATAHAVFDYDPQGSTDTTNFAATASAWIDLVVDNVARVQDRYSTGYSANIGENILARMTVDVQSINGNQAYTQHDPALAGAGLTVVQQFAIEVPFTFGALVNLDASVTLPTSSVACCSAGDGLDVDVAAWLRWDGITDVRLTDGTPISDIQALGIVTGFDYAQAAVVPEPGSAWMLLAGLWPLVRRLRHRRPG
ncbi:MAG: hypothetical protein H6932_09265 [Burkholderiaceae bacterium]|nr:hypothetical protein [Rhodoferax sp.]MCP5271411.1 hypothetical protein [Burkholderiaceae bacterium]